MAWLESLIGWSPDAGSGLTEVLLVLALAGLAFVGLNLLRRRRRFRP